MGESPCADILILVVEIPAIDGLIDSLVAGPVVGAEQDRTEGGKEVHKGDPGAGRVAVEGYFWFAGGNVVFYDGGVVV